jgi:hypothetical protein
MSRSLRYLRITWTVFCGIACVLLVVLWVRSYRQPEEFRKYAYVGGWTRVTSNMGYVQKHSFRIVGGSHLKLEESNLYLPYWLPTVLIAALAAMPWVRQLRWRFSLRTLLIATTLVAVVLGAIVWTVR